MTAPYQTDAPGSTMTSPTSVAVGAMNASACTCGVNPSNENSGTMSLLAHKNARATETALRAASPSTTNVVSSHLRRCTKTRQYSDAEPEMRSAASSGP